MGEQSFKGSNVDYRRAKEKPLETFGRDRICAEPGCNTKLSMYNVKEYCNIHDPVRRYISEKTKESKAGKAV